MNEVLLEKDTLAVRDSAVFTSGDLSVNYEKWQAKLRGKILRLDPKEYLMLQLLVRRAGKGVVRNDMLLQYLYDGRYTPSWPQNSLRVFMCRLRRKLREASGGCEYIETVWGEGYRLLQPPEKQEV